MKRLICAIMASPLGSRESWPTLLIQAAVLGVVAALWWHEHRVTKTTEGPAGPERT
jgi:hypothetical protein